MCVKILCRYFGFFVVSQKGSHVKLRSKLNENTLTTIIPLHRELAHGTLCGILELANVKMDEFLDYC